MPWSLPSAVWAASLLLNRGRVSPGRLRSSRIPHYSAVHIHAGCSSAAIQVFQVPLLLILHTLAALLSMQSWCDGIAFGHECFDLLMQMTVQAQLECPHSENCLYFQQTQKAVTLLLPMCVQPVWESALRLWCLAVLSQSSALFYELWLQLAAVLPCQLAFRIGDCGISVVVLGCC